MHLHEDFIDMSTPEVHEDISDRFGELTGENDVDRLLLVACEDDTDTLGWEALECVVYKCRAGYQRPMDPPLLLMSF